MKDPHRYDDMLHLPHHQSDTHPHMPRRNRAAQFSPFQALTGYGESIEETARFTEEMMDIDENTKNILDGKIRLIMEQQDSHPELTITYFLPDARKEGGAYTTVTGSIKKILPDQGNIILFADDMIHNGLAISMNCILDIQGNLFQKGNMDY